MKKGWEVKKLGEVCKVIAGQSPKGENYNKDGQGLPFYQGKKDFGKKYICNPSVWTSQITKVSIPDDILLSVRAPVGVVNFNTMTICIGRGLASIRPKLKTNKDYIFYYFLMKDGNLNASKGAVFDSINKTQIEELAIPIPNPHEQKKIVKILDYAFERIEKAKSLLEQNKSSAKELFEASLNEIFTQDGANWEVKELSKVCDVRDGTHDSPKKTEFGKSLVTSKNIKNGRVDIHNTYNISLEDYDAINKRSEVYQWNILFSMIGTVGEVAIVYEKPDFAIKNVGLFKTTALVNAKYLYYYLLSSEAKKYIKEEMKGTTQQYISLGALRLFPIKYRELEHEQQEIVEKCDILSQNTKKLEQYYQKKIDALEELKQSLLTKAFAGELDLEKFSVSKHEIDNQIAA